MSNKNVEYLPYRGESASDISAFQRYRAEAALPKGRGKSLLGLLAVKKEMTPEIHRSWSARSFTPIQTSEGVFDEVVCNIAYHFKEHASKYDNIAQFTRAAQEHFQQFRKVAVLSNEVLKLPKGLYEQDGRIITFYPDK
jgi:hypothetical protein